MNSNDDDAVPQGMTCAEYMAANHPVSEWPDRLFLKHLQAHVPLEQWASSAQDRLLPDTLEGLSLYDIVLNVVAALEGRAVRFGVGANTAASLARRKKVVQRLHHDQSVQAERTRLSELHASGQLNWDQLWSETQTFAADHSFDGSRPDDVAAYLMYFVADVANDQKLIAALFPDREAPLTLDDACAMRLRDTEVAGWWNISKQSVTCTLPPGAIVLDVSHATEEDVHVIWPEVKCLQAALSRKTPKGGRPVKEAIYLRVTQLKKTEMWEAIFEKIQEEFGNQAPPSLRALQAGFYRWSARQARVSSAK